MKISKILLTSLVLQTSSLAGIALAAEPSTQPATAPASDGYVFEVPDADATNTQLAEAFLRGSLPVGEWTVQASNVSALKESQQLQISNLWLANDVVGQSAKIMEGFSKYFADSHRYADASEGKTKGKILKASTINAAYEDYLVAQIKSSAVFAAEVNTNKGTFTFMAVQNPLKAEEYAMMLSNNSLDDILPEKPSADAETIYRWKLSVEKANSPKGRSPLELFLKSQGLQIKP